MRSIVVLAFLGSSPAWAAAPQCALPAAPSVPVADSGTATVAALPASNGVAAQTMASASLKFPDSVSGIPFLQHVATAGARILDFGMLHGLHSVAARNGDQFMMFQVAPDGLAAISGPMIELTLAQLTEAAGGSITPLGAQHGLEAVFARSGTQFQVFYATPDRDRVIPGVMWDANGKNLTREQVARIPGAVPTVVVGDTDPVRPSGAPGAPGVSALPLLGTTNFGTVGPSSAPHLWMLIDPQCIYSVRAYQMLHPYIEAGKLQLSIIPLSLLDYEDKGQSTKSALALLSKPADQLVASWQGGNVNAPPAKEAAAKLSDNMRVAEAIGLQGTPTMIWKKPDGSEGRLDGVPTNVEALIASVGR